MIERTVDLTTRDGVMVTFVVHPERDGPHPVVLFLMDAPGMREEIRDMSRRLASAGYYVMAPHLYYRDVEHFDVFETGDRDRMYELMGNLSNAMVVDDARQLIDAAHGDEAADATRVGTVGYCMSGPFTIMVAAALPDRVRSAASIHGVKLAVDADDSPHNHLASVRAEVYVACAEHDGHAPPEMIDQLEAAMSEAGTVGEIEWYPGTEHGFAFAERPVYDRDGSERHWERLHALFRRTLHD